MKKIILSATAIIALNSSISADTIGMEAGYSAWSSSLSGSIKGSNTNDVNINLENDLGYGANKANGFFWVYIDHFVPLIPNFKIQQTNFSTSSIKNTNVTYDNKNYTGKVSSSLKLNQTDFIGYYRLLDNWVNFDLGINIKKIDGQITFSDNTAITNTDKSFSAYIPMLYAKARFDMPLTGLSIESDINYIGYSGSKFIDMKAGLVYETSYGLGATLGYRKENLTLNDIDDTNTNINIDGIYAGLFYHF